MHQIFKNGLEKNVGDEKVCHANRDKDGWWCLGVMGGAGVNFFSMI